MTKYIIGMTIILVLSSCTGGEGAPDRPETESLRGASIQVDVNPPSPNE